MVMIEIENIKKFMAGFLGGNLFDDFLMSEGKLSMNIAYEFDGKILKEFYDTEEWEEMKTYPYVMWQEEKEKIFSLVKGKKTPLSFQFVMMLKPDLVSDILAKYNLAIREDEVAGLFINILYDRQGLKCTAGVSRKTFVLDKTLEEAWELSNKAVAEALDGLPPVKVHCSLLAEEAIHAALWDYAETVSYTHLTLPTT